MDVTDVTYVMDVTENRTGVNLVFCDIFTERLKTLNRLNYHILFIKYVTFL